MQKEFLNCTWKYENDKLFRINKQTKKWACCNKSKPRPTGYTQININDKYFRLHRLVYLFHNPNWDIFDFSTDNEIDHMNKIRVDNRIENLQNVTNYQNQQNKTTYAGKEIKGYYFLIKNNSWIARWYEKGKQKSKSFKTKLEAKNYREKMTQHYYRPCRDITHQI